MCVSFFSKMVRDLPDGEWVETPQFLESAMDQSVTAWREIAKLDAMSSSLLKTEETGLNTIIFRRSADKDEGIRRIVRIRGWNWPH